MALISHMGDETLTNILCFSIASEFQTLAKWQVKCIVTYEEQHNKGHIYLTISHVCHNKILCLLGNL